MSPCFTETPQPPANKSLQMSFSQLINETVRMTTKWKLIHIHNLSGVRAKEKICMTIAYYCMRHISPKKGEAARGGL